MNPRSGGLQHRSKVAGSAPVHVGAGGTGLQKMCSKKEEVELELVVLIMWKIIFRGSL